MSVPPTILDLIQRFNDNATQYRGAAYNETEARREFIDPLFKALGWDLDNTQGYSEKYKEVVHEARVTVGGRVKAPDYAFRVGGRPVFFVEAKRPGVTLHAGREADEAAFQVRRYAWSAKLPVSVLTNFAEFALYDCRSKPARSEGAGIARVAYYTHTQFPDVWDDLTGLLAPEAIRKGALDCFIASEKATRGTQTVDAAFLAEIEGWRDTLARNIALRNPGLTVRSLNFAVQKTIDRIIFLRIAEDRGFEPYHRLGDLAQGKGVYPALGEVFRQADNRYDAGLFYFRQESAREEDFDDFTLNLTLDDKVLKDILTGLYYPESPYAFDALPANILGQVYEQFLGKIIRLTTGGRAKVEEKPEVKKAGGVYYTPTYIVDYIVEHTVGKLLEGKTWRQVRGLDARNVQRYAPLRILDPACGSGTFLLQAYQYLLDWYLEQYTAEDPAAHARAGRLTPAPDGGWRLTTEERKAILLTHLYGVDIDPQAVEVTRLSLLLKVLEGEDEQSLGQQLTMSLGKTERVLPDLGQNIRCGNSLIGSDFYQGQQLGLGLLDEEEVYRINAFDWDVGFGKAMAAGGFDVVIGNPPWGGDIDQELDYYHARYPLSTQEHTDSFKLFIEANIRLARPGGLIGMIVPNTILRQNRMKDVRALILQNSIVLLVDLGENVFQNVVAPSAIFVVHKQKSSEGHQLKIINLRDAIPSEKSQLLQNESTTSGKKIVIVNQIQFSKHADLEFMPPLRASIAPCCPIGKLPYLKCRDAGINYQRVAVGMQEKGKSDLAMRLLYTGQQQNPEDKMYWKGADIDRYWIEPVTDRYCRPNYKDFIRSNEVVRLNIEVYDAIPKILLRQTSDHIQATIDYQGVWFGRSIIAMLPTESKYRIEFFLGILNSGYLGWLYNKLVQEKGRVFAQVKLSKLNQLPIRTIDFDDPADVARHDRVVALVERMLDLHRRLAAAHLAHEKHLLQQQIDVTDKAIDALVYELYALTPEEIAIVEDATSLLRA